MTKKISVARLQPGMFIHDLNAGWLRHPFLTNSFQVRTWDQIRKIRDHGLQTVYIDTAKGIDIPESVPVLEARVRIEEEIRQLAEAPLLTRRVPAREEIRRAAGVREEARSIVTDIMSDVRAGRMVRMETADPVVDAMMESILRNPNALISLNRIKQADQYTFLHSVSVGALMLAFSVSLGMDREAARVAGLGAMLHDIGKMKIPDTILNKPGRLTDAEFSVMKEHVFHGARVLEESNGVYPVALQVATEHHERFDGSGYLKGLRGEEVSEFGKMIAVIDVYDAITSDRCYSRALEPAMAVRKLFEWSRNHFHPETVEQFIKCVGIYPAGTLVRLESGLLAFVVDFGEDTLLLPTVRVVYDTNRRWYVSPYNLDLSSPAARSDRVTSFESPERWNLAAQNYSMSA